ncbi:hypothetical protein L798_09086 [Zootermopsis nevadensis]|uniref:Uncharacterized protein n=1 Tax=Zootermopsis nevadensis TaxID=136037 RepID=A0A067R3R1_ZOONE|nr:hypothetical protein L798_09086 [Zootermopsis nevadensis]
MFHYSSQKLDLLPSFDEHERTETLAYSVIGPIMMKGLSATGGKSQHLLSA